MTHLQNKPLRNEEFKKLPSEESERKAKQIIKDIPKLPLNLN